MTRPARTAIIALVAAVLAAAASLIAAPPESAAQSGNSPCRKDTGVSYPGGKGAPKFTGIPNAPSYEPVTVAVGSRAVVRNLIEVHNLSTSDCGWKVLSKDADWVSLSPESGALAPDKHDTIQVSINSNARSLRPGIYKARIKFQLGPDSDNWHGYAIVHLEVQDKCHIKVRDATRLDIRDRGRIARWHGVMGRPPQSPLQHRIVVWNSSNSQCDLSVDLNVDGNWLTHEFEGQTDIGKFGEVGLMLSANDRWNYLEPGRHQAAIIIRDAISGGDYQLYLTLETEHQPCELVVEGAERLQFEAVARSVPSPEMVVHLKNQGVERCEWRARSDDPWLTVTPDRGDLLGENFKDSVTIAIVGNAANSLKSDNARPHLGAVTFYYIKSGITRSEAVPVSLQLAKPPCQLRTHTPEEMAIRYNPGETVNPARHHLTISLSNEPDSEECRYQAALPNWLESDDRAGIIPEGESKDITVKLKGDTPEAQAGQQEYDGIIAITADDTSAVEILVSLETGCPAGEACAYLHTTHSVITEGETADFSLSIVNPLTKPEMLAQLVLGIPSGWEIASDNTARIKCSGGQCLGNYEIPTGQTEKVQITAKPNHAGDFLLEGILSWHFGDGDTGAVPTQLKIPIKVIPASGTISPSAPQQLASALAQALTPTVTLQPTATPEPPLVVAAAPVPPDNAPALTGTPEFAIAPSPSPTNATDLSSIYSTLRVLISAVVLLFILVVVIVAILVVILILRRRRPQVVAARQANRQPPPDNRQSAGPAVSNQPE